MKSETSLNLSLRSQAIQRRMSIMCPFQVYQVTISETQSQLLLAAGTKAPPSSKSSITSPSRTETRTVPSASPSSKESKNKVSSRTERSNLVVSHSATRSWLTHPATQLRSDKSLTTRTNKSNSPDQVRMSKSL